MRLKEFGNGRVGEQGGGGGEAERLLRMNLLGVSKH
jgi:hypothetical protein